MRGMWLLAVFAMACGGGFCEKQQKQLKKDCPDEVNDDEIAICEEQIEFCTASEERQLAKYTNCLAKEGLSLCQSDGSSSTDDFSAALEAFFTCADEVDGVSEECLLGGSSSTYTYTDYTYTTSGT